MFIFFFFFASAWSALHLYNEAKFMVIGNPVILEQSHAHNAPDIWDRGSRVGMVFACDSPITKVSRGVIVRETRHFGFDEVDDDRRATINTSM